MANKLTSFPLFLLCSLDVHSANCWPKSTPKGIIGSFEEYHPSMQCLPRSNSLMTGAENVSNFTSMTTSLRCYLRAAHLSQIQFFLEVLPSTKKFRMPNCSAKDSFGSAFMFEEVHPAFTTAQAVFTALVMMAFLPINSSSSWQWSNSARIWRASLPHMQAYLSQT